MNPAELQKLPLFAGLSPEESSCLEQGKKLPWPPVRSSEAKEIPALKTHKYLDRVRADVATGRRHGVTGTPTFFVNGHRQDGNDDVRALTSAIRKVISL